MAKKMAKKIALWRSKSLFGVIKSLFGEKKGEVKRSLANKMAK
jgi:hypothetical protein